jgi:hypothetical protein
MSNSNSNGEFRKKDKTGDSTPASETAIYGEAVQPSAADEFLRQNNLGLGNYEESTYWQQIESFRSGMYGDAAFARRIVSRAIDQTKRALAVQNWEQLDDAEQHATNKREYLDREGDAIWSNLDPEQRRAVLHKHTGIGRDWRPPFWRMLMARHEASRSIGARLLDNLFGRKKESRRIIEAPDDGGGLLGGGGGRTRRRGGDRR